MKYTNEQIKECRHYLWFAVKEDYLDEDIAEDMEKREAWDEVYKMMDKGDVVVNDNEGQE